MEEIKWATVTQTNGITLADMLVERLKSAEIPAMAIQESAGKSFGFSVGPLSVAFVQVPDKYLEEARLLLDVEAEPDQDDIVTCPDCESEIELDKSEWEQGWFKCPVCEAHVTLDDLF
jgi:Zn finger protein HypA/HybF involved in hydrogenase expression